VKSTRTLLFAAVVAAALTLLGAGSLIMGAVSDRAAGNLEQQIVWGTISSCDGLDNRVPTCRITYDLDGRTRTSSIDFQGFSTARVGDPVKLRVSNDGSRVQLADEETNRSIFAAVFIAFSLSLTLIFLLLRQIKTSGESGPSAGAT